LNRAGVDAVAKAGRSWPVVEDVPEMAAAGRAHHLRANHPVARVRLRHDAVERRGLEEARPAAARFELRVRPEQHGAATGAPVDAGRVLVPVGAGEGSLRALVPEDLVLLGSQALAPLLVREVQLGLEETRVARAAQRTMSESATNCVAAAAMTSRWKTSWNPKVVGNGFGQALAYVSAPTLYRAPPTITSTAAATPRAGKSCGIRTSPTQPTPRYATAESHRGASIQ